MSAHGVAIDVIVSAWRQWVGSARAGLRSFLPSEQGTTLIETALVLPIILSIIFALLEFSLLLTNDIALTNGVQSAAHFAATSPRAWSNANPVTDTTKIEGWIHPITGSLPNNDAHIVISYLDSSTGQPCGHYSAASNGFVPVGSATMNTCVVKKNLIKVQATYTHTFIGFPLLALFPHGVGLTPSAVILEEN